MSRLITNAEVKNHNTAQSIWMVIHNEVYDVTSFLEEHPGGEESLMDFAGSDGTQGFEDVGHSDDARELMIKYKIGKLPPGEQISPVVASCAHGSQTRQKDCVVCTAANSCPGLPNSTPKDKTWRTFDGSPDRIRSKSPKTDYKAPASARTERRVHTIVVPRERRRRSTPPSSSCSKWKWALLALGAAIVIGVVMKKYMS